MKHLVHEPLFELSLRLKLLLQAVCVHLQHGVFLLQIAQLMKIEHGGKLMEACGKNAPQNET